MKKLFVILTLAFLTLSNIKAINAANSNLLQFNVGEEEEVSVQIFAKEYSVIGEAVSFKAELENSPLEDQYLEYSWNFGTGQYASGAEVSHVFSEIGEYNVNLLVKDKENNKLASDSYKIKVAKEIIILISDNNYPKTKIDELTSLLKSQGNTVFNITEQEDNDVFIDNLLSHYPLRDSSSIIFLSENIAFYNKFLNILQAKEIKDALAGKILLVVNQDALVESLVEDYKNLIDAPYVILLKDSSIIAKIYKNGSDNLLNNLYQEGGEYQLLGVNNNEIPWYRFMVKAKNEMVKNGVSVEDIWIILSLALIATIVVLSRQIVGLKTIGIYTPTLLALAFIMTGLLYGSLYFFVIFLVSILVRLLTRHFKIFYMPKLAILIISVSLTIFALITFLAAGDYATFANFSILPIVIMIMLSEKFLSIHFEFSRKQAWYVTFETILLAFIAYFIVSWQTLRLFVLAYPELILLTIPLNIFLGRWTGLRLLEYSRFSQVIHKEMNEDFSDLIKKKSK